MNVVLITGASDGIGAELARQWAAREGRSLALVLCGRDAGKLEAVAAQCRAAGAQVLARRCDVGVEAECRALVEAALQAYGRLDVLVNNAGLSAHARLADVSDLGWTEALMRINHWGSVWCTHAALPHLIASRGRLVAVSSLAGLYGVPYRSAYCASKFAMTGFFDALRGELAPHGVSVTIAYPGAVATRIRERGFDAAGGEVGAAGLDERGAMPVEVCARRILEATLARRRQVLMGAKARLGRWLKMFAPALVDRLALQALSREEHTR